MSVLEHIREAIDLYVEDCILSGDPVPQEDSVEYLELTRQGPDEAFRLTFQVKCFVGRSNKLASWFIVERAAM